MTNIGVGYGSSGILITIFGLNLGVPEIIKFFYLYALSISKL